MGGSLYLCSNDLRSLSGLDRIGFNFWGQKFWYKYVILVCNGGWKGNVFHVMMIGIFI
jgi:hypothetical protein